MKMTDETKGLILRIGIWVSLIVVFYVLTIVFDWGISTVLIFILLISSYAQIQTFKMYYREIKSGLAESKLVKPYCYTGIFLTLLTFAGSLAVLSLIISSKIYGKSGKDILDIFLKPSLLAYLLLFFGFFGILTSVHKIVGNFLIDEFKTFEHRFSYNVIFPSLFGIISLMLGIFFLQSQS